MTILHSVWPYYHEYIFSRIQLTHQVKVVGHVAQHALFPVETAHPFPSILLQRCVYIHRRPAENGLCLLGAVEVVSDMNPLVAGHLVGSTQLAGQRHRVFLLGWGAAINWETNHIYYRWSVVTQGLFLRRLSLNLILTFCNNKLHKSSQPLLFHGPGASVPAFIL